MVHLLPSYKVPWTSQYGRQTKLSRLVDPDIAGLLIRAYENPMSFPYPSHPSHPPVIPGEDRCEFGTPKSLSPQEMFVDVVLSHRSTGMSMEVIVTILSKLVYFT